MSEKYIPQECPLCDSEGTVQFSERPQQTTGKNGRTVVYNHLGCYCTTCHEAFTPGWMMDENLRRVRKALEEVEVADGILQAISQSLRKLHKGFLSRKELRPMEDPIPVPAEAD